MKTIAQLLVLFALVACSQVGTSDGAGSSRRHAPDEQEGRQVSPPRPPLDREPNDSAGAAVEVAILVGQSVSITGDIGFGDDSEDWFQLKPSSDGMLTFQLTNTTKKTTRKVTNAKVGLLRVLDARFKSIAKTGKAQGPGQASKPFSVPLSGGATYYLKVVPGGAVHAASYRADCSFSPTR